MEANKRIILNTSVQYIKAIVTTILSLFSMRIVLEAIGVSDYGIFSVVGGVIAMLGFITNALVITTQRYVSYYYGRHRTSQVKRFFTNSLFLHIILGLLIGLALLAIKGLLMNDFLKIDPDRLDAAKSVYDITVAILLVTVVTAPFKALFIAKENIVFISLVEMVDAILKLALAYLLLYIQADKLLLYVFILAGIQLLNLLAFALYANWQFPECSLLIRKRDISRIYIGQLLGFAGWTTYGMGAVAAPHPRHGHHSQHLFQYNGQRSLWHRQPGIWSHLFLVHLDPQRDESSDHESGRQQGSQEGICPGGEREQILHHVAHHHPRTADV